MCDKYKFSIVDAFLEEAARLDKIDVIKEGYNSEVKYQDRYTQAILNGCTLASLEAIRWLCDNTLVSASCLCSEKFRVKKYVGTAIETLKVCKEFFGEEPEYFLDSVCSNEDVPSLVWILRRGNITKEKALTPNKGNLLHRSTFCLIIFILLRNYSDTGMISLSNANKLKDEYLRPKGLREAIVDATMNDTCIIS
jgi:hypothetical protein